MQLKPLLVVSLVALVSAASGCKTMETREAPASSAQASTTSDGQPITIVKSTTGDFDGEIIGKINPKSKFAKVKIGMSKKQVDDLIGVHSDQSGHMSGKAFIPFYFGRDAYRTEYYYKKEGRLIFAAGGAFSQGERLLKIVVDPNEAGYAK